MHYGFAIDTKRCIGCHTCAVGCRMENHLPKGIWWNRILTKGGEDMDTPEGIFPDVTMSYVPVACQHCENPACVKACPVGATYKDPETGAVRQDYDKCIGCVCALPLVLTRECVHSIGRNPNTQSILSVGDRTCLPIRSIR